MFQEFESVKSADDFFKAIDNLGVYYSFPAQFILAFDNGDIAGVTLSTAPIRKNKTPYAGCLVHDGTNTKNDWEEG